MDFTNTLVTSVKAHSTEGLTPSDFVSCLLRDFTQGGASTSNEVASSSLRLKEIGLAVSHVFRSAPGCFTMYVSSSSPLFHLHVMLVLMLGLTTCSCVF